ncbi:hypothetical protein K458DRAFT_389996 [Lentithecium fluviatile CBS 122367]|uniref:Uncharacterized protein n=1 Tax=Lentithecium fluviatile CBS 122367 TaxID=1168545 RepID=A0A6G1IZR6_9PLEO|nr:hypothetical protein K458DRAFT_389996 [Lentithecium fluviatile CBS 122367]
MPPKGLYAMGRHHLYGGQMPRRSFNSNDFQPKPEPEKATEADTAAVHTQHGADDARRAAKKERKEKKEKKKRTESVSKQSNHEADGAIGNTKATLDVSDPKKERKKANKEAKRAAQEGPTSEGRKKKRKRDSEAVAETPAVAHRGVANGGFVVGGDLADSVMTSLNGLGTLGTHPFETLQTSEKPSKKKKRSRRKSQDINIDEQPKAGEVAKDVLRSTAEKPKQEKYEKKKTEKAQQPQDEALPKITTPRKTPVPFPQLSQRPTSSAGVLVPETPPPKAANYVNLLPKGPVSFSQPVANTATQCKPSKKERVTVLLSTPTSAGDVRTPKSAPPVTSNGVSRPSVPNALTDANLNKHTKPSIKDPKPRQRSRGAVSTVTSLLESASTPSIIEAFARIGKPYARSGAEVDPFVVPETKVKERRETHEEASMNVFNERFCELQKAVNFTEEQGYLENYVTWGVDNASNQLPCLGNVTGCTAKKEEILRLGREENLTILNHLDTDGGDLNALTDAANRARLADELLMLSLKARVPVPIGRLEGTWTLYCPKYAATHYDRYGYGQRTLTISSIAGFKHKNSYTARLNIPPRSMSYSILAFSTPPHASFRTSTIKTAAEGYTMDVVFLGNGYLQLRVDLNLLLKGKATGEVEGKKVHMEFIGVHEKAVKWFDKKNELEEEAKKLFAKYDGHDD